MKITIDLRLLIFFALLLRAPHSKKHYGRHGAARGGEAAAHHMSHLNHARSHSSPSISPESIAAAMEAGISPQGIAEANGITSRSMSMTVGGPDTYSVVSGPSANSAALNAQNAERTLGAAVMMQAAQAQDIAALNASLNAEEAAALGMSPSAASSYSKVMSQKQAQSESSKYAMALAGEVVGGGVSGYNMGGANNPRAATSNIFHNPLEAALHEAGPFGSTSALSANMFQAEDPTIRQRISESLDTVHDDTLKANLAKKQRLEQELETRREKAIQSMNEMIKQNASAAAQRDGRVSQLKAEAIAARAPNGNLNAIVPGTNKTYGQMVEEEMAKAEHAASHARNPDLYELENAAEKTGFPRPTIGQEIIDQAIKNMIKKNLEEAQQAKNEEARRFAEMKASSAAAAEQLAREKAQSEAAAREAEKNMAAEKEAVQAAEANQAYFRAVEQDKNSALQAGESIAASLPTAGELKARKATAEALGMTEAAAGESLVVNTANQIAAENQLVVEGAKCVIAADEAQVAAIGEKAAAAKKLQDMAIAMQENASARMDLANQKMGEAMVAKLNGPDINKAIEQHTNMIAAAGEAAVAQAAAVRGGQLAAAAASEAAIAESSRLRGADLAAAAAHEKAIAEAARERSAGIEAAAETAQAQAEMAAAKQRQLAKEAAKEAAIAEVAKKGTVLNNEGLGKELQDQIADKALEDKAAAEEDAAADNAGFNDKDPYKILGTIPDDADTVAITNSSIEFPLKTFNQGKAHNQAEAGALAAQNKIRDDIRGKVTAEKFDSPLNTIKGEGGYLNVPENAEKINVESGRAYFSEAAEASMKKEGLDVGHLEHKINTGERADMGIGLGYYVADASGMTMDVPSPLNPDPPRIMTGKGMTLDVTQAQGMDIEKGELKLEKWQEYSRRVRPQVNTEIISTGRESIIEAVIDDDCIKQALKDADAMYNTKSELIVNPSGESFIRVTPPYGVSEQISYDEAVFNLDRIKQSCRMSHGQLGVSTLQQGESSQKEFVEKKERRRGLNIAEEMMITDNSETEERELEKNALETATCEEETHNLVRKTNAFDNQIHEEKKEIYEEGTKALAREKGMTEAELESKGGYEEQLEEEMHEEESKREEMHGENMDMMESKEESMNTTENYEESIKEEEIQVATSVKGSIEEHAYEISKEMGFSQEEFMSIVSKISLKDFAYFYEHSMESSNVEYTKHFEKAKSEIRLLFGAKAEIFFKYIFNEMSQIAGFGDPDERVLIKKETTYIPKMVKKTTTDKKNGRRITVEKSEMMPLTRIVRIPIRKVVRNSMGGEVLADQVVDANIPAGDKIAEQNTKTSANGTESISFEGPNGLGTSDNKIKLGENGAVLGTVEDIQNMVDLASIGHINDPNISATPLSVNNTNSSSSINSSSENASAYKKMFSHSAVKSQGSILTTSNGSVINTSQGMTIRNKEGKKGTLIKKGNSFYINSIDGGVIKGLNGNFSGGNVLKTNSSHINEIRSINGNVINEHGSVKILTGKAGNNGKSVIDDNGKITNLKQNTNNESHIVYDSNGHLKTKDGKSNQSKITVSPFSSKVSEIVIGKASPEECKDCEKVEKKDDKSEAQKKKEKAKKEAGKSVTVNGGTISKKMTHSSGENSKPSPVEVAHMTKN